MATEKDRIDEILKQLPEALQDQVLKFAQSLLQSDFSREVKENGENGSPSVKKFFGVWDSGDPHSADNDRIDSDLARQFSNIRETD